MLTYILKRIGYFIPTFFIISIISFMLGQFAPGDPVELKLKGGLQSANQQAADKLQTEKAYLELSEKYGRDLPSFYFTLGTQAEPDTLYKIRRKADRENLDRLINMYGNWPLISDYYYKIRKLELDVLSLPEDTLDESAFEKKKQIRDDCNVLYINYDDKLISIYMKQLSDLVNGTDKVIGPDSQQIDYQPLKALSPSFLAVQDAYNKIKAEPNTKLSYLPKIHWYGTNNQYHVWLFGNQRWFGTETDPTKFRKGFFRGDFGISYVDDRPVSSIIGEALKWTLLLNIIIIIIIYGISIPSGVSMAINHNSLFDRSYSVILFALFSLPVVWIGTILIMFTTNDYYSEHLNLFPPYGLGKTGDEFPLMERIMDRMYHFILPITVSVIGSFAYISRQMRGSMLTVIRQDYIRTAFAKGLPPSKVYWKHTFRNSLIPIITIFSSLLPSMIGGSVIMEFMFNIPGMGRVSYDALSQRNYPVLFTILMFSAVLTMLGNLLSDVLYALTDPRISFNKKV